MEMGDVSVPSVQQASVSSSRVSMNGIEYHLVKLFADNPRHWKLLLDKIYKYSVKQVVQDESSSQNIRTVNIQRDLQGKPNNVCFASKTMGTSDEEEERCISYNRENEQENRATSKDGTESFKKLLMDADVYHIIIDILQNEVEPVVYSKLHHLMLVMHTDHRSKKVESIQRLGYFVRQQCAAKYNRNPTFSVIAEYVTAHQFTELHLDHIIVEDDDKLESNTIPSELFLCANVKYLSLTNNHLNSIPVEIGRLRNLLFLALTGNKLTNDSWSIPYTLTFCTKLQTLYLNNNLLDALPGFLLSMPSLKKVHRHGNHNYFQATFMFYHTDVNRRIRRKIASSFDDTLRCSDANSNLQLWAARSIIGNKLNYFTSSQLPEPLKKSVCDVYGKFNVCYNCSTTAPTHVSRGHRVMTFKSPYLGNTCVPFEHFACSMPCADAIDGPARAAQTDVTAAYESHIKLVQEQCGFPESVQQYSNRSNLNCFRSSNCALKCLIL